MVQRSPLVAGTLVRHPKRPEWGLGELLSIEGDTARVRFQGVPQHEGPIKTLNLNYVDLQPEQAKPASPYAVTFPKVLYAVDWPHKLTPGSYRRVEVPDARETVQWYFPEMYLGVEYEAFVQGESNRSAPNTLTHANFEYTRKVTGIGWGYADVQDLIGRTFEELEAIPLDADIFDTDVYDRHAVKLLTHLHDGYKGIKVANASKLLYQKRPKLIPIFDDFVRRALNIYWVEPTYKAFELGFSRLREVGSYGENGQALDRTIAWLIAHPEVTAGLTLSKLRVLDILAWGVIQQGESPQIPPLL